jgi:hypothetical protein
MVPAVSDPEQGLVAARDRAARYVRERGDALAALRAGALLGELPGARVTEALAERGAFDAGAPAEWLPALAALDQVDQLDAPTVAPAVDALAGRLGEDGAWGDPAAPLEERIVLTADLGGFLTKTLRWRPRYRVAVEGFLARTWSPDRVKRGAWAPIAAYAHFFSFADSELSDPVLQWCGRELDRGFRTRLFDAGATARVLIQCRGTALPGASLTAGELAEALVAEQTEDGGFALSARALAGEPVEAALDALALLARLVPPTVEGDGSIR